MGALEVAQNAATGGALAAAILQLNASTWATKITSQTNATSTKLNAIAKKVEQLLHAALSMAKVGPTAVGNHAQVAQASTGAARNFNGG